MVLRHRIDARGRMHTALSGRRRLRRRSLSGVRLRQWMLLLTGFRTLWHGTRRSGDGLWTLHMRLHGRSGSLRAGHPCAARNRRRTMHNGTRRFLWHGYCAGVAWRRRRSTAPQVEARAKRGPRHRGTMRIRRPGRCALTMDTVGAVCAVNALRPRRAMRGRTWSRLVRAGRSPCQRGPMLR